MAKAEAEKFINEAKTIIREKGKGVKASLYSTDGNPAEEMVSFAAQANSGRSTGKEARHEDVADRKSQNPGPIARCPASRPAGLLCNLVCGDNATRARR
jgi:hypothetical protein